MPQILLPAAAAEMTAEAAPFQAVNGSEPCGRCSGTLLPGKLMPHPETKWGIISDLPESFSGYGVLYSTRPLLPPNGGNPELLRQRRSAGFRSIDDGFDVFLFHLNKSTTASQRLVVCVQNHGEEAVTLHPQQVIKSEGVIGRVHEFESTLGARVLRGDWDRPLEKVTIPPGQGRVVAYGKNFGLGVAKGPDSSRNVNSFGYARVRLADRTTTPDLEVSVIAIPAGKPADMNRQAELYSEKGARSTDKVSLRQAPQGCTLGRAVGVYPNFIWTSDHVTLDTAALPDGGTSFPMALPDIQTGGCPEARQTADLVLHPGYTRPETIGNYMVEYDVRFTLTNSSIRPSSTDLVLGKDDGDVGLAYSVTLGAADILTSTARPAEVKTAWAGPKQSAREKSLLERAVEVAPGEERSIRLRFLILGNSSLPFQLGLRPARGGLRE